MNRYKIQLTPRARASIIRILNQLGEEVSKPVHLHLGGVFNPDVASNR